jgi:probable phosphoglycerate mutase
VNKGSTRQEESVYVVRHGQSTWNRQRRWAGHADPPLTDLGRQQAKEVCASLEMFRFVSITSSGLSRARETARIIADELNLKLLDPVLDMNERHYGDISGLTSEEIGAKYPEFLKAWREGKPTEIPGGEPWQEFHSRILLGLRYLSSLPGNNLIVAHMGVLRAIEINQGWKQTPHDNLSGVWITP